MLIWGCSGSGKSTFARALCRITGLDHVSIDAHFWQSGWVESDRVEFRARMAPILARENWVLDGNYITALEGAQILRATHIFFFDLPRWRALTGVAGRIIKGYGRVRPEMAPGCPEKIDYKFLIYVWTFRSRQHPKIFAAFEKLRADQRLQIFRSRNDAEAALDRIAREGLA
ncbi:MAG: DNA topology modulation protein [Methylobacterium sp.]|nr:DNA topology modulation protein [Methylobacterium sp.]